MAAEVAGVAPDDVGREGSTASSSTDTRRWPPRELIQAWFGAAAGEVIGRGIVRNEGITAQLPPFWEIGVRRRRGRRRRVDRRRLDRAPRYRRRRRPRDQPGLVEGQDLGAATQGLGAALLEEMIYDGQQLVNPNLVEYRVPRVPRPAPPDHLGARRARRRRRSLRRQGRRRGLAQPDRGGGGRSGRPGGRRLAHRAPADTPARVAPAPSIQRGSGQRAPAWPGNARADVRRAQRERPAQGLRGPGTQETGDRRARLRATERQRGSGQPGPAWPGNARAGRRHARLRATERQRGSGQQGLRGPGTQETGDHVAGCERPSASEGAASQACVAGERKRDVRSCRLSEPCAVPTSTPRARRRRSTRPPRRRGASPCCGSPISPSASSTVGDASASRPPPSSRSTSRSSAASSSPSSARAAAASRPCCA